MNYFASIAFGACLLPVAAFAQGTGTVMCEDDLAETKILFLQKERSLSPQAAHDIANLLNVYESQCHTEPSGGNVVASDLARIRSVLNGHARLSDLPAAPGTGQPYTRTIIVR